MNKLTFSILLFLGITFTSRAQKNDAKFWNALLTNNREKAASIAKKKSKKNIKNLLLTEIERQERGRFTKTPHFLDKFLNQPEFENYLYALWNEQYLFSSYLESGFNNKNINTINRVYAVKFKNKTLQDAMCYLKAVSERYQGNWDSFISENAKINAIDKWQYCGVFENLNKSGLDRVYPPELNAFSTTDFDAESNGKVNWYPAKKTNEPYYFFSNHEEFGSGVSYAQTFIEAANQQRVLLRMGNGSAFKIWLNDVLVLENDEDKTTDLNGYQIKITIPKGNNRLLIKNAEGGSGSYFGITLLNEQGDKVASNLKYGNTYSPYNKSTLSEINPVFVENEFEVYFKDKIKNNPDDFFYKYCLINTYFRNEKYKEAKTVLLPILSQYPKSSLLNRLLIKVYVLEGSEYSKINEVVKNMEHDDENYYLHLVLRLMDSGKLKKMSIAELEIFLDKIKIATDLPLLSTTASLILEARKQNIEAVKGEFEALLNQARKRKEASLLLKYSGLYKTLYNDDDKIIKLLEEINDNYFSMGVLSRLAYYYEKQNKKDKAIALYTNYVDRLTIENTFLKRYEAKLYDNEQFEDCLSVLDHILDNFPYSFVAMREKGNVLLRLGKKKEALAYFEKSLGYDSGSTSLRKKINDLKGIQDPIDQVELKNVYEYIAKNRGEIKTNNYGHNILLDEAYIELYPEGGGRSKYLAAYEITSDAGVDNFKEYNLGLSGSYTLNKTELVKKDGSLSPAERSGSNLVFKNVAIGDVVYLDYSYSFSKTGRFYKDYTDYYQLNSFHPVKHTSFNLIVPKEKKINYKVVNDQNKSVKFTTTKSGTHKVYTWALEDAKNIPQSESYKPVSIDVTSSVHVSTIASWNEIAVWYSDLVRSRVKIDATVQQVFDELFPNGFQQLSALTRSKIIYNYVTTKFNYSSVNFRQSGYVPQLPSRTIETKLGDCKDFSTLFVTLAKMAKLDANLVLVLTADKGKNSLVLPSSDFNHCIVRLRTEGKEQYLELTVKYLPFGAQPMSLMGANALNIPHKADGKHQSDLIQLTNANRVPVERHIKATINLLDDATKVDIKYHITGYPVASYIEKFNEPNETVKKKSFFKSLSSYFSKDFTLDTFKEISRDPLAYQTNITVKNKFKEIGAIKIYKIPALTNPYTSDIVSLEKRSFPIRYTGYENTDLYQVDYDVNLPEGKKFIEIPKNKEFSFKKHHFSMKYTQVSDTHLKVALQVKTSFDTILPADYQEFKKYVNNVLEAEEALVGFK